MSVVVIVGAAGAVRMHSGKAVPAAATVAVRAPAHHVVHALVPVKIPGPLPGALLIADRGNNRMLLVDPQHRVLWRFPTGRDLARGIRVYFNDDGFVEPGGKAIVANEEEAHTIISVNIKTHVVTHLYGTPGVRGSGPNELNTPDDAYVLPDGTLTVADAYNCRILFIRAHRIVRQLGRTGACYHHPPYAFGAVNGDTPLKDGGVLVSEIPGSWIDNIAHNGRLRWAVRAPVSYPSDPQILSGGRILLAGYTNPGTVLIMNTHGTVLWRYAPSAGLGALDHPSLAMMLPNGDIAINDDFNDRVVIVDPNTNAIVWQYGHTRVPGTRAGLPQHAGRDGLRPARPEPDTAVEPRASSVAAVAARPCSSSRPERTRRRRLVTAGYPYASSCPQAGDRDDVDRWKMNTCNCTSYAAWVLWRNGYRVDWFVAGSMDAWNWPNVARRHGIPSGSAPRVGSVAVWPKWGKFGHIGVVTAVHGNGTFDVAEYNLPGSRPEVRVRPTHGGLAARRHVRLRAAPLVIKLTFT